MIATLSVVNATEQASVHLRIHSKNSCTITNESQCNGQNWTGSTCCADPNYECRWDTNGLVQRCQKKNGNGNNGNNGNNGGSCTITNESQCDGQNWTGSTCCADSSYECRRSDDGQNVKRCQKKHW
ncbi:Fungal cellulose binding domain [Phytophthora infestans]|nr:Fungal cellulose binding domain [Phytophthora infestans]KAF4143697.1 Fungal cellulose binding domain [Phytophthora infestans]KAF4145135.1 Fungal cellulose binding domain [Phytophthora infestans]